MELEDKFKWKKYKKKGGIGGNTVVEPCSISWLRWFNITGPVIIFRQSLSTRVIRLGQSEQFPMNCRKCILS